MPFQNFEFGHIFEAIFTFKEYPETWSTCHVVVYVCDSTQRFKLQ